MKNFMAGLVMAALSAVACAQTGLQYPDEMIAASINGDEAKVLETKARADLAEKPQRGDRKSARALNTKGLADISAGSFDSAIESLTQAGRADPLDAEVPSNLGYAYMKQGAYEQAKRALAQSISLQPGRSSAWATLAEAFARAGDIEKATACFNIAYTFSQNRDKTKEFLSKIVAENADAKLTAAAKAALEAEGIKPLKKEEPSQPVQHQPTVEQTTPSQPEVQPTPPAAPATVENTPSASVAQQQTPTSSQPDAASNESTFAALGVKYVGYGVALAVLVVITLLGIRRIKARQSVASPADQTSKSKRAFVKPALGGVAVIGVGLGIVGMFTGEKQIEVSRENLAGTMWNCSMDAGTTYLMAFPTASDDQRGKAGVTLVTKDDPNGKTIIQAMMPFKYQVDGQAVVLTQVGISFKARSPGDSKFVTVSSQRDSTQYRVQIPLLTAKGMIFVPDDGGGSRACNRIDQNAFSTLAFGVDGVSADRTGQPNLKKFMEAQSESGPKPKVASSTKASSASTASNDLFERAEQFDVQAYLQLLSMAQQNRNPACRNNAEMLRDELAEYAGSVDQSQFQGQRENNIRAVKMSIKKGLGFLRSTGCLS